MTVIGSDRDVRQITGRIGGRRQPGPDIGAGVPVG
jgi:hypothetical protein